VRNALADSLLKQCNPSHALQAIAARLFIALFGVKPFLQASGKQVKCPVVVTKGMFGLRVWAEIEGHLVRRSVLLLGQFRDQVLDRGRTDLRKPPVPESRCHVGLQIGLVVLPCRALDVDLWCNGKVLRHLHSDCRNNTICHLFFFKNRLFIFSKRVLFPQSLISTILFFIRPKRAWLSRLSALSSASCSRRRAI
jgi:hypothetical protein